MELTVACYRSGRDKMPTSRRKNCDDLWVVPAEGPSGPECTKSVRALIGLSA